MPRRLESASPRAGVSQTEAGRRTPSSSSPAAVKRRSAPAAAAGEEAAPGRVEKTAKPLSPAEQAERHYREALTWMQQGHPAKTEEALRAALASDPGHVGAREWLAGLLLQRGHSQEALALLEEGLALANPTSPRLALLAARLYVEQGADDRALTLMEKARAAVERDAAFLSFLATLYQRAGRHAEAVQTYTEAVGLDPSEGRSWLGLGISLEALRKNQEAVRAYERALLDTRLDIRLRRYAQERLGKLK
jgi:MSHA biogenesis protein MshN